MLNPEFCDYETMIRLPKIYYKSNSSSSATKSSLSLQDQLTAKSWLFVTPNTQLGNLSLNAGFRTNIKREIASITKTMTCICTI